MYSDYLFIDSTSIVLLKNKLPHIKFRLADESLKIELMNAKEEIERIQRSWEKKFAILQQR